MKKITKKTKLSQIIKNNPDLAKILIKDYGLHCLGCFAVAFETLEQGAKAHGMSAKEIDKMVKNLNQKLKTKY